MEDFNVLKKTNYGKNICTQMEGGVIFFDPDSLKEVVGARSMTYDEYLDVQFQSMGKIHLIKQGINQIICETCFLCEQCNRVFCMRDSKERKILQEQMFEAVKRKNV